MKYFVFVRECSSSGRTQVLMSTIQTLFLRSSSYKIHISSLLFVCCILGWRYWRRGDSMLYFFLLDIIVRTPIISSVTLLFILSLNWQYRTKFDHKLLLELKLKMYYTSRTSEIFWADSILFFRAPTTSMDSVNSVQRCGENSLESSVPSPGQRALCDT